MRFNDLRENIFSYKEVLIVLNPHFNGDELLAGAALFSSLKNLAESEKTLGNIDLLISSNISEVYKNLVGGSVLKYVKDDLESKSYVISLPKDGKVDKVKWREENDYFKLLITPAYGDLSIHDVKFEEFGASYKLAILVGFDDISAIGDIYSRNKMFFDRVPKIILGSKVNDQTQNILSYKKEQSVTSLVYDVLKSFNLKIDQALAQLLLNGIIESVGGSFANVSDKSVLEIACELMDLGASTQSAFSKPKVKGTFSQLQLQQRIFANIKQDSAGILWSVINSYELKDLQIEDSDINVNSAIPFNSYQGYDKSFVLFELRDGTVCGRIETEDLNAFARIKSLTLNIEDKVATFTVNKRLDEVEKELISSLKLENVVENKVEEKKIESSFEVLTKPIVENKNISQSNDISVLKPVVSVQSEPVSTSDVKVDNGLSSGGLITPDLEDDGDNKNLTSNPIISNGEVFGPPKIFNTNSFGGPFSGMGQK